MIRSKPDEVQNLFFLAQTDEKFAADILKAHGDELRWSQQGGFSGFMGSCESDMFQVLCAAKRTLDWKKESKKLQRRAAAHGVLNWRALQGRDARSIRAWETKLREVWPSLQPLKSLVEHETGGWQVEEGGQTRELTIHAVASVFARFKPDAPRTHLALRLCLMHDANAGTLATVKGFWNLNSWTKVADVSEWIVREANQSSPFDVFDFNALRYLARLSPEDRHAALHNRKTPKKLAGLRNLNHRCVTEVKTNPRLRMAVLPLPSQWKRLTGLSASGLKLCCLDGFKVGTLLKLRNEFPAATSKRRGIAGSFQASLGDLQAMFNLVRLLGDYSSIRRFVARSGHPWSLKGLHDAGQFSFPEKLDWDRQAWTGFCLRHPGATKYIKSFTTVQTKHGMPTSLTDLRQAVLSFDYPEFPKEWSNLRKTCIKHEIAPGEAKTQLRFWAKARLKTAEFLPHVQVDGPEVGLAPKWKLIKLSAHDHRGPMLGLLSACCQHLSGAGSESAIAGVESPYSGFYVVLKDDEVAAQSWAWRATNGSLVFDSWETRLQDNALEPVGLLVAAAAQKALKSPLGVPAVLMGRTTSGATGALARLMGLADKQHCVTPMDGRGYFDGRFQQCIAGRPNKRATAVPAVEGYKRKIVPKIQDHEFDRFFLEAISLDDDYRLGGFMNHLAWDHADLSLRHA